MLRVSNVSKSYGAEVVLRDISCILSPGDRVGLVGPNGAGKSTLLHIIAGIVTPDSGSVWIDPGDRVAYLPQYPASDLHLTVRESLWRGSGVADLRDALHALERALSGADSESLPQLLDRYASTQEQFDRAGGYALDGRMEEVIEGLRIGTRDLDRRVDTLSGGNKTKLSLARLLLSDGTILLLDEPTNYLDLQALLWLEAFVTAGERSYIIVSHDRRFLDRTVEQILEVDAESHTIRAWPGNFSEYAEAKLHERRALLERYADQQAEIRRIEQDIQRTKEQARGVERTVLSGAQKPYLRKKAKKVAKKAKVRERRLEKLIESPDLIEKPKQGWNLHLVDLGGDGIEDERTVLEIVGLRAGYGQTEVLHGLDLLIRGTDRVALLGENGSGKTTLLRCVTGEVPYSGSVRVGPSIRMGTLSQEGQELPPDRRVIDVFRERTQMREDEARTYLHRFLFVGDQPLRPIGTLSYGQRQKLALALLILGDANFLILDEPTSHMDLPAMEAMETALERYHGPLLLVSHDRYFIERVGVNRVTVLRDGRLMQVDDVDTYEQQLARTSMT